MVAFIFCSVVGFYLRVHAVVRIRHDDRPTQLDDAGTIAAQWAGLRRRALAWSSAG